MVHCLLWRGKLNPLAWGGRCGCDALPGDHVCAEHAAYFRGRRVERCRRCGRKLVGEMTTSTGACFPSCEDRACDEALVRQARDLRRGRRTRRCDRTKRLTSPGPSETVEP